MYFFETKIFSRIWIFRNRKIILLLLLNGQINQFYFIWRFAKFFYTNSSKSQIYRDSILQVTRWGYAGVTYYGDCKLYLNLELKQQSKRWSKALGNEMTSDLQSEPALGLLRPEAQIKEMAEKQNIAPEGHWTHELTYWSSVTKPLHYGQFLKKL